MKLGKLLLIAVFVTLVAGFGYFAFTPVDIEQTEVIETIPSEKFLNNAK